jgi:hypothetical protein
VSVRAKAFTPKSARSEKYPHSWKNLPPAIPPLGLGFQDTAKDIKKTKAADFSAAYISYLDCIECLGIEKW